MAIKNVSIVGANGLLGPTVLDALISAKTFTVTVINRASSKSTYPSSVHEVRISDHPTTEELVQVLRGQDGLVVTFAGSNETLQIQYADAAAQAGVQRFIPADFGSCDSTSPRALELVPLYSAKQRVRQHLQRLAADGKITWTSVVCGHFFDKGFSGLLAFDSKTRKAQIFDGGDVKWSSTTTKTVGLATVRILQKDEETKNRMLYIQSLCVSQNEVLEAVERLSGQKWQVTPVSSDKFIKETQAKLEQNPNDADALEEMVSVVGIVDSNWEGKDDFANPLLGLEDEFLDTLLKEAAVI